MSAIKAVVTVIGQDQKGVVARFATFLAEKGVNILDLEQQVVQGLFIMDMLVDLADLILPLDELIMGARGLGDEINMDVRITLHNAGKAKRVAILATKEDHCLEQLIEDWQHKRLRGEIVCVLANHETLREQAEAAGLPFECCTIPTKEDKPKHFAWLMERLAHYQPDLVVLARYMQVVPSEMVAAYPSRIINIHPSLLPFFPGAKPYHKAWEAGVRVAGCTAHYVTEELDQGPIILQDVFQIEVGKDTAEDVKRKGQLLEGRILSDAVQMHLDEKLIVVDGKVVFRPGLSRFLDHL